MQLTRFSDLSLRLLLYLAAQDKPIEATATIRNVAVLFNVPYTHLVKVAHQLGLKGWLITSKGKGGGIRLARTPDQIRIGDVLRVTEPRGDVIDCLTQACPLRDACSLKDALDRAYAAFFRELDQYTLADIATMPSLQRLVQITP